MAITKLSNSGILSGNLKYDSMLAGNQAGATFLIQRINSTPSATTVTFSNIPQNYQHLQIRGIVKTTSTAHIARSCNVLLNNDSAANYAKHTLLGNGTSVTASGNASTANPSIIYASGSDATVGSSIFGVFIVDIHDYTSTSKNKTMRSFNGMNYNTATTSGNVRLESALWMSTAAITTISISVDVGNFAAGSTFALYGMLGA